MHLPVCAVLRGMEIRPTFEPPNNISLSMFMRKPQHLLLLLFFYCFFSPLAFSQVSKATHIANARKELIISFQQDDPAGTSLWMDSLARLEDEVYAGLLWDERWLLYFWLEAYGSVFDEAARFD